MPNIEWSVGELSKPQEAFCKATSRYVAYGGARGGGKSHVVRKKAVLVSLKYRNCRTLIIRRTFPQVRDNHIIPLLEDIGQLGVYRDTDKIITFPSTGSTIKFGYCESEADVGQYQGQQYDFIFIDEATQFTKYQFDCIKVCCRGTDNKPKRVYLTCNPGGVGHAWVKRLFIDRDYNTYEIPSDYTFISAKVSDNKALMEADPEYVNALKSLPEELRKQWLDGDWDVMAGQFFPDFKRDVHVVKPFIIPMSWRRYFAMDYGLDMLAGYWIAVTPEGRSVIYREVYEKGLIVSDAAKKILDLNSGEPIYEWYAPPDLWNRQSSVGKTAIEMFSECGIDFTRSSNSRIDGWLSVHELLKVEKNEFGDDEPRLRVFSTCTNLIRCVPTVQCSDRNPNDVSNEPHELTHSVDALRYYAVNRFSAAPQNEKNNIIYAFKALREKTGTDDVSAAGYGDKRTVV